MVEYISHALDPVFHALGDATRRHMLLALSQKPRTVSELAQPHDMSLAAASKHIKVLEAAGLLTRDIHGRTHTCRLNAAPLASVKEWVDFYEEFWTRRLDVLESLLKAEDAKSQQTPKTQKPKTK